MDYGFFKAFDQLCKDVASLTAAKDAEIAALHQQITDLVNALAIEQAAKDALNAKVAALVGKSAGIEDRMRSAVTSNPQ